MMFMCMIIVFICLLLSLFLCNSEYAYYYVQNCFYYYSYSVCRLYGSGSRFLIFVDPDSKILPKKTSRPTFFSIFKQVVTVTFFFLLIILNFQKRGRIQDPDPKKIPPDPYTTIFCLQVDCPTYLLGRPESGAFHPKMRSSSKFNIIIIKKYKRNPKKIS